MTSAEPSSTRRKAGLVFIFITAFLDVVALGIVMPVMPLLVADITGGDEVNAAGYVGLFGATWALMQFIFSPVMGSLSDRFGRRSVIILSNFGLAGSYILFGLAPTIFLMFLARILSGVTSASLSAAQAYIADITPPEKRAERFGFMGAIFGFGFIIGPVIGGVTGQIDPRAPFWIAAALGIANGLYGYFILPESLAPENRTPFSWRRANPLGALQLLRTQSQLLGLGFVHFVAQMAHYVLPSVFALYAAYRYGWTPNDIGLTLGLVGVCAIIVQGGLIKYIVRWLGETRALVFGLAAGAAGFYIYGLAGTGALFMIGIPIMAFWGVAGPALQSLMTQRLDATNQGKLQGALASIMGISGMVGPLLFTQTFSVFAAGDGGVSIPGAPFYLAAFILLSAIPIALFVLRGAPSKATEPSK